MKPPIIAKREKRDLRLAQLVLENNTIEAIRSQSLKTSARWRLQGHNPRGFDEWMNLFETSTDDEVIVYMTSMEEKYIALRKSPPYCELMTQEMLDQVTEELRELINP